jgi:uncharacterized protein
LKAGIRAVSAAVAAVLPAETGLAAQNPGAPAAAYTEVVRSSFYVPVRDGTRLAVNVYRPAVNGRAVEDRSR